MNTEQNIYISKYFFLSKNFFSSHKYSIKYFLSVFFNLYLIIVFLDVSREALPIPTIVNLIISGIRDFSIYSIVIYLLVTGKSVVSGYKAFYFIIYPFIPLFIYLSISIDGYSSHPIKEVVQFCILSAKPFLFLYVLFNIRLFYLFNKNNIIKTFVLIMIFMFCISVIVFCFFPSLIIKYDIENRFGLGNMSVQSGLYCCAYFLCLYYFPYKTRIENWLSVFILVTGIFLSVSSTGILSALVGTLFFLLDKRTRKRSWIIILLIAIILTMVVVKYYSLFSHFIDYFVNKAEDTLDLIITVFLGEHQGNAKSASFHARELQIDNVIKNHNALIYRFFGHGYFSITDKTIFVENTYFALYFDCGIFGLILLTVLILTVCLKAVKLWVERKSYIGISSVIIFLFFMTTLDVSILPSISTCFVFLLYFIFHDNDFKECVGKSKYYQIRCYL